MGERIGSRQARLKRLHRLAGRTAATSPASTRGGGNGEAADNIARAPSLPLPELRAERPRLPAGAVSQPETTNSTHLFAVLPAAGARLAAEPPRRQDKPPAPTRRVSLRSATGNGGAWPRAQFAQTLNASSTRIGLLINHMLRLRSSANTNSIAAEPLCPSRGSSAHQAAGAQATSARGRDPHRHARSLLHYEAEE